MSKAARILVVEDNEVTRKMVRVTLQSEGYAVLEAEDGRTALEQVAANHPDLVLQDLKLPDIDGLDLVKRLRALPHGSGIPIIAFSGFQSKMEQARLEGVGFTDYVFKPINPSRLVETLRTHLGAPVDGPRPGRGRRVLVVDDDPVQLKVVKIQLEQLGFRAETARDGLEAIAQARRSPPDGIVSDVLMPRLDGFNLCQKVRMDPALANIPVLLLSSAYVEEEDLALARRAGANEFILWTADGLDLRNALLDVLNGSLPAPVAQAGELPTAEYTSRVVRQLERQSHLNRRLTQRVSLLEAQLAIGAGLAVVSKDTPTIETVTEDALHNCFDAAGVSIGAAFLLDSGGRLALQSQLGYPESTEKSLVDCFGHADLFLRVMEGPAPVRIPSPGVSEDVAQDLLAQARVGSLLLLPLAVGGKRLGLLLVGSSERDLGDDWVHFVQICANHIAQCVGLAVALVEQRRVEEQLHQSQKVEAIGQLAGGVAHDFNNLLTVISGYSEVIWGRLPASDPVRSQIEEIQKAANRAATLTRQLLAFGRRQILAPRVLDLNLVVAEMDKLLRRLIGEDIELATVQGELLGRVKADPGQIEQVIMNLAVNARDAMPKGGKLTIETANVDLDEAYARGHVAVQPGPFVMLAVSDIGCGMDKKTQSRIFEPFFTTKEEGKGTGLGLSTVYGIVKQSGGNIWVYSEPGRGTTFKMYLPRVEEAIEEISHDRPRAIVTTGTETILVTEDSEMVRTLACEILVAKGYSVLEARHGAEAIEVCERHKGTIHLMITDIVMPQMGGGDLARHLASVRPEMKVLYMSGYTSATIAHHLVLDPGKNFLQKPFNPSSLALKVRETLDSPGAAG
jgi:CheY-like chemotaxis protein